MKVIFLDFDGVMDTAHYDNYLNYMELPYKDRFGLLFDPDCVLNLSRIVDTTGAQIVVTSTWKQFMTYEDLLEMWHSRRLPGILAGITPNCSRHRGDEIDAWLEENDGTVEYVIVDDMDESQFNEHQLSRLFVVNPYDGLNDVVADSIISLLT